MHVPGWGGRAAVTQITRYWLSLGQSVVVQLNDIGN